MTDVRATCVDSVVYHTDTTHPRLTDKKETVCCYVVNSTLDKFMF